VINVAEGIFEIFDRTCRLVIFAYTTTQMDSALFNHIISQTRQNVEFLISHKQISPADGREILAKLPNASERTMAALEQQTQNLLITPPPSTGPPSYPQTPAAQTVRAKALWDYGDSQVCH
jgi:hypothetical protein